jgi:dimethylglycine dehydrogenase
MIRVSYVGELGYELHMPAWQLMSIYESMHQVCKREGIVIRDFGTQTMNALRLEKAYRTYGHEFTEEVSAVEAMMDRFLDTSRDFIGAENLRQREQSTPKHQLAFLAFDDDVPCECFGNEAVYDGDEYIGVMTSGGFGHRVGYSVGFAYITPAANVQGKSLNVLTTMGVRKAHVEMDGVYDPENKKLRA